jgi:hypothetical protein
VSERELNREDRLRLISERLCSAASDRVHEYPPEKPQQLLEDARFLDAEVHRYRAVLEEIRFHANPSVNLSSHNNVQAIAIIQRLVVEALWEMD